MVTQLLRVAADSWCRTSFEYRWSSILKAFPPNTKKRHVAATVGSLVVVVGFVLSALVMAGPKTPITFQMYPLVSSYMHPHFPQNWQLFAPKPISEERGLVAKVRCSGGKVTEFVDITTPIIEELQATRVFPSRESRIISNGMITRFKEDAFLKRIRNNGELDGNEVSDKVESHLLESEENAQEIAEMAMARFASHKLADNCAAQVEAVKLRYVFHKFPGWSSRNDLSTKGEIKFRDSRWVVIG